MWRFCSRYCKRFYNNIKLNWAVYMYDKYTSVNAYYGKKRFISSISNLLFSLWANEIKSKYEWFLQMQNCL